MSDKPRIRVVAGRQELNGVPVDYLVDCVDGEVVISDTGDARQLIRTSFEAGRQYQRLNPELDAGEVTIDDPLGLPPAA